MRMFVAIVPPEEALEDLEEFLSPRREAGTTFRWADREQWHVTLAFMAQVADRSLDDLVERLRRAAGRRTPFPMRAAGGGAFPNPARARVLYAALQTGREEELRRLATGARAAASKAGADTDGGRFRPHLTLARLRNPEEVTRWVRVLDSYRGPEWTAQEVVLVRSHLGQGPRRRPRYEVVEAFPLGGQLVTPSAPCR